MPLAPPPLSPEESWLYLLTYVRKPDAPEYEQLVDLLREHADLLAATRRLADESLAAHPAPRSCGDLFGAGRT